MKFGRFLQEFKDWNSGKIEINWKKDKFNKSLEPLFIDHQSPPQNLPSKNFKTTPIQTTLYLDRITKLLKYSKNKSKLIK